MVGVRPRRSNLFPSPRLLPLRSSSRPFPPQSKLRSSSLPRPFPFPFPFLFRTSLRSLLLRHSASSRVNAAEPPCVPPGSASAAATPSAWPPPASARSAEPPCDPASASAPIARSRSRDFPSRSPRRTPRLLGSHPVAVVRATFAGARGHCRRRRDHRPPPSTGYRPRASCSHRDCPRAHRGQRNRRAQRGLAPLCLSGRTLPRSGARIHARRNLPPWYASNLALPVGRPTMSPRPHLPIARSCASCGR